MKKIEIILTQAIEGDFIAKYEIVCKREKVQCKYTKTLPITQNIALLKKN